MRYTAKHYYSFKNIDKTLLTKESLNSSQIDKTSPCYIPEDRNLWIEKGLKKTWLLQQAQDIVNLLKTLKISEIFSIGAGGAWLEYNIKKLNPSLHLICSDCTPKAMERLKKIFEECDEIKIFDALKDEWKSDVFYLFYRVDTDFSDKQWRKIFEDMRKANVKSFLFIPALFLDFKIWFNEKLNFLRHKIKGKPISFAGYIRTKDAIKNLLKSFYRIEREVPIGELTGFLLKIK